MASRIRQRDFWIAAPEIEYSYLLAKKAVKGKASLQQALRFKQLVEILGREKAVEIAGEIFRSDVQTRIVDACAQGSIDAELRTLTSKKRGAFPFRQPA